MDWFEDHRKKCLADVYRLGRSSVAKQWAGSRSLRRESLDAEHLAFILNTLRDFAVLAEVPKGTVVRYATLGEDACAAAGYQYNSEEEKVPYILIDASKISAIQSPEERLDVSIGLLLHEAAHLLWSGKIFESRSKPGSLKRLLENVLEDYRIEELMALEAPGWFPYIFSARQVLIYHQQLERTGTKWPVLSIADKLFCLMFMFIRTPHLLSGKSQLANWCDPDGRHVLTDLRTMMPTPPQSAEDVIRYAELIDRYVSASKPPRKSMTREAESDWLDEFRNAYKSDSITWGVLSPEKMREIERIIAVNSSSSLGLKEKELRSGQSVGDEEIFALEIVGEQGKLPVRLVKLNSRDGQSVYQASFARVRPLVEKMRSSFPCIQEQRYRAKPGSSNGKLHGKSLFRASFDDRVFTRKTRRESQMKTQVVLLLDASGSMQDNKRDVNALLSGILLAEAFRHHQQFNCEIFSHSTSGDGSCEVTHYVTPQSLGMFRAQNSNIDGAAIQAVTELVDNSLSSVRRIIIVVSDGLPCGYRGECGSQLLERAIAKVRKQGWKVLSIDVGNAESAKFYGEEFAIKIAAPEELPQKLGRLLVRTLR